MCPSGHASRPLAGPWLRSRPKRARRGPSVPKERYRGRVQRRRGKPAAYLRVSTSGQDTELQRQAIERAALARGDAELAWFEDTGSGRSWERPALAQLKAAIFRGEVGRLYVFKLDRLSRMGVVDTSKLVGAIHAAGCELISLSEGFDFASPGVGALLVAMLAFAAELEWSAQQDRLTAARETRRRAGKSWGRPPKNSGALRARILELRGEGRSIRAISMALKVPKSTVQDCISAAK